LSEGAFRVSGLVLLALAVVGCHEGPPPPCTPVSGGLTAFSTFDEWCQASLVNGDIQPIAGVTPYTLNTPLFSDYAVKRRTVWMPSGSSATYDDTNIFDFPDGTVFTKSFGFADDLRKAQPLITWVESRVIWKNAGVWQRMTYVWDAAQTVATADPASEVLTLSWIDVNGQTVTTDGYLVPGLPQCDNCHQVSQVFEPIGPKARNLNGDTRYPDGGVQNQLTYWTQHGLLDGAPDASVAPKLAVWNDPTTGTLDQRARAYLESNCAHCHSLTGAAKPYGLYLSTFETNPVSLGICKRPIAAGQGACGLTYDIVPGSPDSSIMNCRVHSAAEGVRMPELERSVVDVEGAQLISDWMTSLSGSCP
jgi:uncharacterized repeat protein (TIGR03806 family)